VARIYNSCDVLAAMPLRLPCCQFLQASNVLNHVCGWWLPNDLVSTFDPRRGHLTARTAPPASRPCLPGRLQQTRPSVRPSTIVRHVVWVK